MSNSIFQKFYYYLASFVFILFSISALSNDACYEKTLLSLLVEQKNGPLNKDDSLKLAKLVESSDDNEKISEISFELTRPIYDKESLDWLQTGFMEARVALVEPGQAGFITPIFEKKLKEQGISIIMIKQPSQSDLNFLLKDSDFQYGPLFISRRKKTIDLFDEIDLETHKSQKQINRSKSTLRRKLKKTDSNSDYTVLLSPLELEGFGGIKKIFDKTVKLTQFGVDTFSPAFTKAKLEEIKTLPAKNYQILISHKEEGIVGGLIFELIENGKTAKVWRAAFSNDDLHRKNYLGLRAFSEMTNFALDKNIAQLSYGTDTNFYGEISSIGLQRSKSELGFGVAGGEHYNIPRLMKILNPDHFGPYISFVYKDKESLGDGLNANIYGEFPENYVFPKGMKLNFIHKY